MGFNKKNLAAALPLNLVTSRRWLHGRSLVEAVEPALKSGVTCLQVRETDLPFQHYRAVALPLKQLCDQYQIPLIVNNNLQLVEDINADGVHLVKGDATVQEARRALGPDKLIGLSVRTVKEALKAQHDGADYLYVGPIFPVRGHNTEAAVSPETLQEICRQCDLPVVAIGGISAETTKQLKGSGVAGVAAITSIMAAPEIDRAAAALKQALTLVLGSDNKITLRNLSPRGIIFDMDGTLLDSMPAWYHLAVDFLEKHHLEATPDIDRLIEKLTLEDSAQYFAEHFPLNMSAAEVMQEWQEEMARQYKYHIGLKPGVEQFIKTMSERQIKMCVATLTDRDLAEISLQRLGLDQYLQFIITVGEVGQRKNDPKIFYKAAKKLGLEPQECLVFEDALYAISAAKNAGFPVCGIMDALSPANHDKVRQVADLAIESFEELN